MKKIKNIGLVILCFLLGFEFKSFWPITTDLKDAWWSALLQVLANVVGGILGGFVAYLVAKYQIIRQEKGAVENRKRVVHGELSLISLELKTNIVCIDTFLSNSTMTEKSFELMRDNVYSYAWDKVVANIHSLNEYNSCLLEQIYRAYLNTNILKSLNYSEDVRSAVEMVLHEVSKAHKAIDEYLKGDI